MRGNPGTCLPSFDVTQKTKDSYFRIQGNSLLFINVETDYQRIAPLLEAALALSKSHKVFFLDLTRAHRNRRQRLNDWLYDLLNGGWLPRSFFKKIQDHNITLLKRMDYLRHLPRDSNLTLSREQQKALSIAIHHENQNLFPNPKESLDWLSNEENSKLYAIQILALRRLITSFSIDVAFVWNFRFLASTIVRLSCESTDCDIAYVESGALWLHEKSFDIFMKEPVNFWDRRRRMQDLSMRQSLGLTEKWDFLRCKEWLLQLSVNKWTVRFNSTESTELSEKFDCIFFTSSMHEKSTVHDNLEMLPNMMKECLLLIVKESKKRNLSVGIRVHPNPSVPRYEDYEYNYWNEFNANHLENYATVIHPASQLSSYNLAERSVANFCLWSTIGLEIAARGLPSMMMEKYFDGLSVTPTEELSFEIRKFLDNPKPMSKEDIVDYTNYFVFHGFSFSFFNKRGDTIFYKERRLMSERGGRSKVIRFAVIAKRFLLLHFLLGVNK